MPKFGQTFSKRIAGLHPNAPCIDSSMSELATEEANAKACQLHVEDLRREHPNQEVHGFEADMTAGV